MSKMKLPKKLPITRIEDYHTHYLGEVNDGRLFWGYETFAFTKPYSEIQSEDWKKFRTDYAVLHIFDKKGNYLESKYSSGNLTNSTGDTSNKLEELMAGLGFIQYRDIAIKLFQTTINGIVFGLIPDQKTESIILEPSSTISFQEPWDGEYYT